jgi:hypothetical protein
VELKYVIFDGSMPVIFGGYFQHKEVRAGEVTSAGFCSIREVPTPEDSMICTPTMFSAEVWGESVGLGVKSDPHDAELIERMLNSM